jgi:hypothetical protein
MAVAVTNRDIYVFAREIDVMQRARHAEVDFGMHFCKAAEPMDEPLGSKIRRQSFAAAPGGWRCSLERNHSGKGPEKFSGQPQKRCFALSWGNE